MNLGIIAIVAGVVFLAEIPDKTMIATVVMSSRSPALPVWLGAIAAFTLHSVLAVAAGRLLAQLPHRDVEAIVTTLFAGGALYLLVTRESTANHLGKKEAAGSCAHDSEQPVTTPGNTRALFTAFGVIAVGELGDLTQILTANMAARYHAPLSVFLGAVIGLGSVSALGVLGGRSLLQVMPLGKIRKLAGALLALLALYSAVELISGLTRT